MRIAVRPVAQVTLGTVLDTRWMMRRARMFARIDDVTEVNWDIIDGGDEP